MGKVKTDGICILAERKTEERPICRSVRITVDIDVYGLVGRIAISIFRISETVEGNGYLSARIADFKCIFSSRRIRNFKYGSLRSRRRIHEADNIADNGLFDSVIVI